MRRAAAALALALAASGCAGGRAALGRELVLEDRDLVWSIALSPDGRHAAVVKLGSDAFLLSWLALDGAEGTRLPAPRWEVAVGPTEHDVEVVEVSPDGATVATAGADGAVRLFDARDGRALAVRALGAPQRALAWAPDGAALAAAGDDGGLAVLAGPELQEEARALVHAGAVRAVGWARDGRIFTGGWDKAVKVSRLEAGALAVAQSFELGAYVNDLGLDAEARTVAVALSEVRAERTPEVRARERRGVREPGREGDCAARLDGASGRVLERTRAHRGVVSTVALSPDGKRLASGGWDAQVVVTGGGPERRRSLGWIIRRVRFSRDGRRLAIAAWTPPNPVGDRRSAPAALGVDLFPASP